MLCSSRVGGDGDAAFMDISLKIKQKPVTLNIFTSTSLPDSLRNPPVHQHSALINQVPSQVTLADHLPDPLDPSHVEAQARAHKHKTIFLTTMLVSAYPRACAPDHAAPAHPLPYVEITVITPTLCTDTNQWFPLPQRLLLNPRSKAWATPHLTPPPIPAARAISLPTQPSLPDPIVTTAG